MRAFVANLVIQIGDPAQVEAAVKSLEEGLQLALTEKQREVFESLLERARAQVAIAPVMQEIKTLLEGAVQRVNQAVEDINRRKTIEAIREGSQIVVGAIQDAERASVLAKEASLGDAEKQALLLASQFRAVHQQLQNR